MSEPADSIVRRLRGAGCVFAEDEAALLVAEADSPDELDAMVDRRVSGLPLEHILGWAGFYGLRIAVEPGVFVPRRRTEFLAAEAIRLASADLAGGASAAAMSSSSGCTGSTVPTVSSNGDRAPDAAPPNAAAPVSTVVVDLCCGAGAIAAAVVTHVPGAQVFAADIDPAAVSSARRNLSADRVFEGDLFDALPASLRGSIAVLVANTPYVPTDAIALMPPEARLHESRLALDGGPDGLDVQRRVAAAAPQWLRPGGHLLVEASELQAPLTAALFAEHGLTPSILTSDELYATVVVGALPQAGPR